MLDVERAVWPSVNFELYFLVIFEEKCKAIALVFGRKGLNFDWRAIVEFFRFSGSVCTVGEGEGAMGRGQ